MSDSLDLARSIVVACSEFGVCEWVVCPGARNVALLQALDAAKQLKIWTHFDERSAGFFALGRIMASQRPVALVCTSGTAVAELLPAVIEAHYQGRPLIVISADRPADYRGSGAPQAIEQQHIFGSYASYGDDVSSAEQVKTLLQEWSQLQSLHLNVCLQEPQLGLSCKPIEQQPADFQIKSRRPNLGNLAAVLRGESWQGLVLMVGGLEDYERDAALWLCRQIGAPVVADATSGLRESLGELSLCNADTILKKYPPSVVLRLGDVPVGRCWRDLEDLPQAQVFSITRSGFSGLARPSHVVHCDVERAVRALGDIDFVGDLHGLLEQSRSQQAALDEACLRYPHSELAMVREVSLNAAMADMVYLGNSMPVREWNLAARRDIEFSNVFANRGANGIDGQIATFLGCCAAAEQGWALLGDLTAMYDSNALAMSKQLQGRLVAVVINNHGGQIFRQLPAKGQLSQGIEQMLIQPHEWDFAALAQMWQCHYLKVESPEQLDFTPQEGLTLVEVLPDSAQSKMAWEFIKSKAAH